MTRVPGPGAAAFLHCSKAGGRALWDSSDFLISLNFPAGFLGRLRRALRQTLAMVWGLGVQRVVGQQRPPCCFAAD